MFLDDSAISPSLAHASDYFFNGLPRSSVISKTSRPITFESVAVGLEDSAPLYKSRIEKSGRGREQP